MMALAIINDHFAHTTRILVSFKSQWLELQAASKPEDSFKMDAVRP